MKNLPNIRVGAVSYLNTRPLVHRLTEIAPQAQLTFDLPSRLADQLAAGELDVALIPSIEFFQNPHYTIVSDACIACRGPVFSVKLLSRVEPSQIDTLALDEGSRTSAALVQILLKEQLGVTPRLQPLPIGDSYRQSTADAVLVIGDRAMHTGGDEKGEFENGDDRQPTPSTLTTNPAQQPPQTPLSPLPSPPNHHTQSPTGTPPTNLNQHHEFPYVWDLGDRWQRYSGLPFVFAMWTARWGTDLGGLDIALSEARSAGLSELMQIAQHEGPPLGLSAEECYSYLHDNLHFTLGEAEQQGLELFYQYAASMQLAPKNLELPFRVYA